MSNPEWDEPSCTPELYRRIGYDPDLEARALERLSHLDASGCRDTLARLVKGLDLAAIDGRAPQIAHLLLDILQRVNRRVHRYAEQRKACELTRMALIQNFTGRRGAESTRRHFLATLDRLLQGYPTCRKPTHPLVEKAATFIEENYSQRISLSSIARRLHVSSGYLSRLFRRETGTTVTAFLHRVRLENARPLLADGERSLSEIAYRVGYRTYRDFYRNFVKHERASPRQFRRRLHRSTGAKAS